MTELEFHPLAKLFPVLDDADFSRLVDDIKAREKVTLYQGSVLDGRHRYLACRKAGG
jgi:hypothetical protein